MRQRAAPGVENHHGLGAGFDLRVEVQDHGLRGHFQHVMQQVGTGIGHFLDGQKIGAALAFDHVGGQRPWAAGEADQRHGAVKCTPDLADRIDDILQVAGGIRHGQVADFPLFAQRTLELGAFALGEIQPKPHRVRHGEDVGEQDGGVQRESRQRLQRHFGGEIRVLAQIEKAAGALARGIVFRQVAAGLAHHPYRRVLSGLTQQRPQESVVLEMGHFLATEFTENTARSGDAHYSVSSVA
ncbi:hypothetical protein GALL_457280 [mine drainage metagenome]|uniref:Uncharacterized protein n=1 Tax=mine drainage metagenome TaxID=410659 RepID=A0A1J5Q9I8_9ZZZZ